MGRLARQLGDINPDRQSAPRALLLVDEVGALGHSARHLRGLVGRARESGLAVVLATQGPSDLEGVDRALLPQVRLARYAPVVQAEQVVHVLAPQLGCQPFAAQEGWITDD